MSNGFAFREAQPVIDQDPEGLRIVAVYPAGAAYPVAGVEDRYVRVLLPSGEDDLESTFPEDVGVLTNVLSPAPAKLIPYVEAAKLYPDLIGPEDIEDYESAAKAIAEWR